MRIIAITICINYSDYLSGILANAEQFDRWIIVTTPEDRATISLCRSENLEIYTSDELGPGGEAFDSAFSKHVLINAAISHVKGDEDTSWIVLVDADTLLPKNFRTVVEGTKLYPRALYGLQGRRICESWEEFTALRNASPWRVNLTVHENIMGYFQMFRIDQENIRYPVAKLAAMQHDDIAFQYAFKSQLRRIIPLSALHIGPAVENWSGRSFSGRYEFARPAWQGATTAALKRLCESTTVVIIGGMFRWPHYWRELRNAGNKFYFISDPCDSVPNFSVFYSSSKRLRETQESECKRLGLEVFSTLHDFLKMFSNGENGRIPGIYFDLEFSALEYANWLLQLRRKFPHFEVAGRFYGLPTWVQETAVIDEVFGSPNSVYADGSWLKRCTGTKIVQRTSVVKDAECKIVLLVLEGSDILSIRSLLEEHRTFSRSVIIVDHTTTGDFVEAYCLLGEFEYVRGLPVNQYGLAMLWIDCIRRYNGHVRLVALARYIHAALADCALFRSHTPLAVCDTDKKSLFAALKTNRAASRICWISMIPQQEEWEAIWSAAKAYFIDNARIDPGNGLLRNLHLAIRASNTTTAQRTDRNELIADWRSQRIDNWLQGRSVHSAERFQSRLLLTRRLDSRTTARGVKYNTQHVAAHLRCLFELVAECHRDVLAAHSHIVVVPPAFIPASGAHVYDYEGWDDIDLAFEVRSTTQSKVLRFAARDLSDGILQSMATSAPLSISVRFANLLLNCHERVHGDTISHWRAVLRDNGLVVATVPRYNSGWVPS